MAWTCFFEVRQAKMLVDYMQNFSGEIFYKAIFLENGDINESII
jgi:hypothetical protein